MDLSDHYTRRSVNRLAFSATVHCLAGCSIGEFVGMILGAEMRLPRPATIALSTVLAFAFGYFLTMVPLIRGGTPFGSAMKLAFASDSLSIAVMEIVDNAAMLLIPGAMEARPGDPLFWGSLVPSLLLAGTAAFPVTRWLILRGGGHTFLQAHHGPHASSAGPPGERAERTDRHGARRT